MKKILITLVVIVAVGSVGFLKLSRSASIEKINGASFVAPHKPIVTDDMRSLDIIHVNWVAIIPYAFSKAGEAAVTFNHDQQWWGERVDGTIETIKMAKELDYKVMLKPHVWVRGQGWAGDFDLNDEEEWLDWEKDYRKYIMTYAKVADSLDVELLCIGTEYRQAVVERQAFWEGLIKDIRKVYSGKLTYAANWDNFEKVQFWHLLDYIGIDSYFPLSTDKTPTVNVLKKGWEKVLPSLENIQSQYNRPILFTEYGYQSIDYTSAGHWNYNQDTLQVNLVGQANAYEAIYKSLWNKEWFAGGFLWKWHAWQGQYGGIECKRFTPQNKPAQQIIAKWHRTFNAK